MSTPAEILASEQAHLVTSRAALAKMRAEAAP